MNESIIMAAKKQRSAQALDALHDSGKDLADFIDYSTATRPGLDPQRVNVDFPQWMVGRLDREAQRRGITRQALCKYGRSERRDNTAGVAEPASEYGKKLR